MYAHNERSFPQAKLDSDISVRFILNEHGDLYCLLHNNSVHISLFDLRKIKKNVSDGKKILVKACTKPLLWDANYDRGNNNYMNALRPRRFKWCNFSTNFMISGFCMRYVIS